MRHVGTGMADRPIGHPAGRSSRSLAIACASALALVLAACANNSGGRNIMGDARTDGSATQSREGEAQYDLSKIMTVEFADGRWDHRRIPRGQQCSRHGGDGSTPALSVNGIPERTKTLTVAFNDTSEPSLAKNGGLGVIGYPWLGKNNQLLHSVPGETTAVSGGVFLVASNRDDGKEKGYLPPCSGGKGHVYTAVVSAVDSSGNTLAQRRVVLGRY
jgi:phosphatidylethanolamine-binding protein (PEBP) family uncharacterized protein